jgi:hypothetical protein
MNTQSHLPWNIMPSLPVLTTLTEMLEKASNKLLKKIDIDNEADMTIAFQMCSNLLEVHTHLCTILQMFSLLSLFKFTPDFFSLFLSSKYTPHPSIHPINQSINQSIPYN